MTLKLRLDFQRHTFPNKESFFLGFYFLFYFPFKKKVATPCFFYKNKIFTKKVSLIIEWGRT